MKTIKIFFILLQLKYKKNKMHPTYYSFVKHAWRLAKEVTYENK